MDNVNAINARHPSFFEFPVDKLTNTSHVFEAKQVGSNILDIKFRVKSDLPLSEDSKKRIAEVNKHFSEEMKTFEVFGKFLTYTRIVNFIAAPIFLVFNFVKFRYYTFRGEY